MQVSRNTWLKIGGVVIAIIVAAFVLNSVFALLRLIIPLAVAGILGFFAYRWYAARQERPQSQAAKPARQVTVPAEETAKPAREVDEELASWDKAAFVRQVERLAERERELEQAAQQRQKDAVARQLAERRRRLGLDE